jgi:hypothetical protein
VLLGRPAAGEPQTGDEDMWVAAMGAGPREADGARGRGIEDGVGL